jgi:PAS domain S-box-containing protein
MAADLFEMSLDLLCVAGFDGYLKQVNSSWSRTLGWSVEELTSRPSIELVHPDDRAATLAARHELFEGVPLHGLVNRYLCKDGSYRWFEWRSIAHADRGVVYCVARDVTADREAKRVHEQLHRQLLLADRMASVGTLAAGIAHEINNPLAFVMVNLDTLLQELAQVRENGAQPNIEGWAALALEAQQGTERIQKIVRGLKTFSRAEDERRAVIDLGPVLALSIEMTANEIRQRARLQTDFGPTPPVEADDGRLGQLFINLLVNAAQAVGDTGSHEIRVSTSTDAAGRAVVEIRDTGPGIPESALPRIFDPFFTTKPIGIGTGLGLSICHSIVTALGGELTAENHSQGGALFRVVLPAAARAPAPAKEETPPTAKPPTPRRARVLIVDDESAVAMAIARTLAAHEVTVVTSARDALERLSEVPFDVVISDLMMPEMSGMELYDEIQRRLPHIVDRIVFVTGGAFTASARAFLERVPNPRLEKPFAPKAMRALVERVCNG